ncbi:MAG: HRDC domain-containing protein [Caldilineaceae bacterium]|nr:HRDC domain-containing protein [Caldilineaceae bacterium]
MVKKQYPRPTPLGAPVMVNTPATFAQMIAQLREQPIVGVDTESNSLFRYYPKVCLIQLTAYVEPRQTDPRNTIDYLLDPLALKNLSALAPILQDPATEVIMHAAENDIILLQRDFGFQFGNVFDTQLAARILGWKQVGLAAILQDHFGVASDKSMQRTDWGQRPLNAKQITYAQLDTHFLPALRLQLIEQLQQAERWEEAQEAFALLRQVNYHEPATRTFWQMKNVREVPLAATNVLAALWQWRENEAQRLDWPPFKVMTDAQLAQLAIAQPLTTEGLASLPGFSSKIAKQYGRSLLQTIGQGQQQPLPELPEATLRPEQLVAKPIQNRYEALRHWRTEEAEKRGVQPDIVFTNSTLLTIAQAVPQSEAEMLTIPTVGPWKARTYGPAILATLRKVK